MRRRAAVRRRAHEIDDLRPSHSRGLPLMARQQRAPLPTAGRRRRGPERMRPRKYTRINVEEIDYKDLATLRRFISDRGKIRSRRVTGLSRRHH